MTEEERADQRLVEGGAWLKATSGWTPKQLDDFVAEHLGGTSFTKLPDDKRQWAVNLATGGAR